MMDDGWPDDRADRERETKDSNLRRKKRDQ